MLKRMFGINCNTALESAVALIDEQRKTFAYVKKSCVVCAACKDNYASQGVKGFKRIEVEPMTECTFCGIQLFGSTNAKTDF